MVIDFNDEGTWPALIKAQIRGPLSGVNRKALAHFETYRF
jgi:hypothetical protein